MVRLYQEVGRTIRSALGSWCRTARLCTVIIVMAGATDLVLAVRYR